MDARSAAESFSELFQRIYLRFHDRRPPSEFAPSRESLAVLAHLAQTGPLTVTEAARHFDRSQAATSEIIARLERRGLIERIPDRRDRRRALVWLTEQGVATWRRSTRVLVVGPLAAALETIDDQDRSTLLAVMAQLLEKAPSGAAKEE